MTIASADTCRILVGLREEGWEELTRGRAGGRTFWSGVHLCRGPEVGAGVGWLRNWGSSE